MKCRFYLQTPDNGSADLGVFDFENEGAARDGARARLEAQPTARWIDVWSDRGELFRVEQAAASDL